MKTKNKHGFTLIELLAVIVVLAIIALIATPIVMKTIKNAKKGAAERSADSYIKQVETTVATERLEGNVLEGEYTIQSDGDICPVAGCTIDGKDKKVKIEVSGNKPKSGTIKIESGQVTLTSTMDIGGCNVTYDSTNKKYVASEKESTTPDTPTVKTYTNGEVVYFNVTTGEKCSNYTETQSNTGTKSGCMKFYAFNDNGGDRLNLLLDHNTTDIVIGSLSGNSASGPDMALDQLKSDTEAWLGTLTPLNYTMDQTGQTSNVKYTIDYSTYKARLVTAQEIAEITGNTSWDEKVATDYYHFDSKTSSESDTCKEGNTTGCKYGWLYDRTSINCTTYGCLNNSDQTTYGYWTASSSANYSDYAWFVDYKSNVNDIQIDSSDYGVRPVIEVLKSKLS